MENLEKKNAVARMVNYIEDHINEPITLNMLAIEALYEPIGMWLPKSLQKAGTSEYCQGVEVPITYSGKIPEGFDLIELPPCKMMVFQGNPYDDENFGEEIGKLWDTMKKYDPKVYGFEWADEEAPRFQLAPMGYRGYIEARPVRQLNI